MQRVTWIVVLLLTGSIAVAGQEAEVRARAHFDRAVKLAKDARHSEAVAEFDKAIELSPNNARYHLECGRAMISAMTAGKRAGKIKPVIEDYIPALKVLGRAMDLDDSLRGYAFLYTADAALACGDIAGTRKTLQTALAAAPEDPTIKEAVRKKLDAIGR